MFVIDCPIFNSMNKKDRTIHFFNIFKIIKLFFYEILSKLTLKTKKIKTQMDKN